MTSARAIEGHRSGLTSQNHGGGAAPEVCDLSVGNLSSFGALCYRHLESIIYSVSNTEGIKGSARKTKERYPATTYSPTPLPGQYHRRWWA